MEVCCLNLLTANLQTCVLFLLFVLEKLHLLSFFMLLCQVRHEKLINQECKVKIFILQTIYSKILWKFIFAIAEEKTFFFCPGHFGRGSYLDFYSRFTFTNLRKIQQYESTQRRPVVAQ